MRLANLGLHFYADHFGTEFFAHDDSMARDGDCVLFPDEFYERSPLPFENMHVAIVGNGAVNGRGKEIDEHDVVVRLNYPYLWKRDPFEDGIRMTHWAGLARNEVFDPTSFHNPHAGLAYEDITAYLESAEQLYCISHHHVQSLFWQKVLKLGLQDKFHVHWSTPVVFEQLERSIFGKNRYLLSEFTSRKYTESGFGGWYTWDTLLSGVRTCILALMCRPRCLHIYGMNFYADGVREPWDLHDLQQNKNILNETLSICVASGIDARIFE